MIFLRNHVLMLANGLLYLGPMVAGMAGFSWGMVAAFTAIFILWLVLWRPEQWPALDEWQSPTAWLAALTLVLSQVALIAVLFGIGTGIGAVAGLLPIVNPILPLAISFLAIPLCRMVWDAAEAADRGIFLDEEAERANAPRAAAAAAAAVVPLLNLGDDAPAPDVAEAVDDTLASVTAGLRLRMLASLLAQPDRSHAALRRALILWTTEPERVAAAAIPQGMALAFAIADRNGDLLRLYVPRALALIAAFPDRAADFPAPTLLREVAGAAGTAFADLPAHLADDLRDGLLALAAAVEAAEGHLAEAANLDQRPPQALPPAARVA
jgi:hypothetical protein